MSQNGQKVSSNPYESICRAVLDGPKNEVKKELNLPEASVLKSLREHMQSHARRAKNEAPNLPEANGGPLFFSKNEPKWPKNVIKSLREHMQSHA